MNDTEKTPAGPAVPERKGAPRWMKVVLVLSLGLNVLLIGAAVGGAARHGFRPPDEGGEVSFGPFTEALSREDRSELRRRFLAEGPGIAERLRDRRQDFDAFAAAIRAEPYDPAAVAQALGEMSRRIDGQIELGQRLLLERLSAMTPGQRQAFADKLEEGLKRRHH